MIRYILVAVDDDTPDGRLYGSPFQLANLGLSRIRDGHPGASLQDVTEGVNALVEVQISA